MSSIVLTKTFIDIYSLPDLELYYAGWEELAGVNWKDVPSYKLTFLKCPEIGFRYILKIGSFLGDFKWSLLIIASIHAYAFINVSKKNSPYVIISLIIFTLGSVQSYFVLRQWLAIAVTMFSYQYIISRNWKMFILLMLLAFSFHQTALVFILIYFFYGIKNVKFLNISLVITGIILLISFSFIFNHFATSLIGYEGYIDSNEGNITTLLISLCYFITYIFFLKSDIYKPGINKLIFIMLALNFIIMLAGHTNSGINRLMMYYSVSNILSVPITIKYIKQPVIRYLYTSSIIAILMYLLLHGNNSEYLNPI